MRNWGEALLAVLVLVAVGAALFLFTGQPLEGGGTPDTVPVAADPEAAARGATLAEGTGCLVCHSADGTPGTGPTWKGVFGSSRPLEGGGTATADEEYLRISIVDPSAQIVAGYRDQMPADYETQLTAEEISDLVEYIKSLSA